MHYTAKRASICVEINKLNKQLMHTFAHFFARLKTRFCTLASTFVFDVNIYSSSLRLFKTDNAMSSTSNPYGQYIILALSWPLRWLRVTFF